MTAYVDFGSYLTPQLNVSIIGYGSVQGTSAQAQNFSCNLSACAAPYAGGDSATLSAIPAVNFTFSGWSGDYTAASGPCILAMDADKYVVATFTTTMPALLLDSGTAAPYPSLTAAYGAASDNSSVTIEGQGTDFGGGFTLDRKVTVDLKGGFDSSFNHNAGWSLIHGKLSIRKGLLTVERVSVYP